MTIELRDPGQKAVLLIPGLVPRIIWGCEHGGGIHQRPGVPFLFHSEDKLDKYTVFTVSI